MIAFVKIKGGGRHNHGATGKDVRVYLIDENGVEHSIALTGFTLSCDGRNEKLLMTATMVVDEVELDGVQADLSATTRSRSQTQARAQTHDEGMRTLIGMLEGMKSDTWAKPTQAKIDRLLDQARELRNPIITIRQEPYPNGDPCARCGHGRVRHAPGCQWDPTCDCDSFVLYLPETSFRDHVEERSQALEARVLVHADGGDCHGSPLVDNPDSTGQFRCEGCGLAPNTQSVELWPESQVRRRMVQ